MNQEKRTETEESKQENLKTVLFLALSIGATWLLMHLFLGELVYVLIKGEQAKYWYWGIFIFLAVSAFGAISKQDREKRAHEAMIKLGGKV